MLTKMQNILTEEFYAHSTNININDELINSFLKNPLCKLDKYILQMQIGIVNGFICNWTYGKGGLTPIQVYNNFTWNKRKFIIKMTTVVWEKLCESSLYALLLL